MAEIHDFYSYTHQYTAWDAPELAAYYVGPQDSISFIAEIINNSNSTMDVYAAVDVEYIKGKPAMESTMHLMNVGMCDGKGLDIRPDLHSGQKKFAMSSKPMTVQKDGDIIGLRKYPSLNEPPTVIRIILIC